MSSGLSETVHSLSGIYLNHACALIINYYLPIYLWKELTVLNILDILVYILTVN